MVKSLRNQFAANQPIAKKDILCFLCKLPEFKFEICVLRIRKIHKKLLQVENNDTWRKTKVDEAQAKPYKSRLTDLSADFAVI